MKLSIKDKIKIGAFWVVYGLVMISGTLYIVSKRNQQLTTLETQVEVLRQELQQSIDKTSEVLDN